jgi:hypothetical protein
MRAAWNSWTQLSKHIMHRHIFGNLHTKLRRTLGLMDTTNNRQLPTKLNQRDGALESARGWN